MNKRLVATALSVAMAACGTAQAADLQLLNADPAGVGLNSTAYAAPVGGNTATTVGGQRVRVYQYALALWGNVLGTNTPLVVQASFAALTCAPTTGVLGSAGPAWSVSDSTRRYHGALANALFNTDFAPGIPEIVSQFNSELGTPACLTTLGWYYGLDGKTPPGKINFLNVVMHEIGHGLGVAGYINKISGSFNGVPDFYTALAYDNNTGKLFVDPTMTNALRAAAMRTVGATAWTGANVNQQAALLLDTGYQDPPFLQVTAPAALARPYGFQRASFGPTATPANFAGDWVLAIDPVVVVTSPSPNDGCSPLTNAAAIAGKIAMIDRGACSFDTKVKNAQDAGATGVVILNSNVVPPALADSNWGGMSGTRTDIVIPSVLVRYADGLTFKSAAPSGGIAVGPVTLAGMDSNGRTRLYSPWIVATGSTFSHFDTAASPNLLMEPFDTPQVQAQFSLDLTPALLRDMGWPMNDGTTRLPGPNGSTCDTGVDASSDGGITIGGNIAATNSVCLIGATRTSYNTCMANYANKLYTDGLITSLQRGQVLTCVRRYADRMR